MLQSKGIVPNLIGGLGNQLFILAAAFAVQAEQGCPLYLFDNPVANNKHNRLGRDYKASIFREIGTHISRPFAEAQSDLVDYVRVNPGSPFHPWNPKSVQPGTVMNSYFQYYPAIQAVLPEFGQRLLAGLGEFTKALPAIASDTTAFIHIRRGDYLENPHIHYIQIPAYYRLAMDHLFAKRADLTKLYIISDDIAWAKEQSVFKHPAAEFWESDDELLTFALMAQCKGGAICANSTYSWWGAALGAHQASNPIVVPKRWISDPVYDLFPESWIRFG